MATRSRLQLPPFAPGTLCHYCGQPADDWDHVIPLVLYGPDNQSNVVPCCYKCNNGKRDRWPDVDGCEHCMEIVDAYLQLPGHLEWAIAYMERRTRLYGKALDRISLERMKSLTPYTIEAKLES